jgi:SAM-dependent methyltransferase
MLPNRTSEALHEGSVLDRAGGHTIIACQTCGFAHVVPLPDERALTALYAQSYYAETKPDYLARAREDEPWARLGFDDRLGLLEAHLPPKRRRLLDVGSGPGFFLARARERGWDAQGIDPSQQACAHAHDLGLRVMQSPFDDSAAEQLGQFDAIALTNMLEHVADPIGILGRAWSILDAQGLLCVTVPNDYNPLQETLRHSGIRPWWVAPPHHLNYFTFDTLSALLTDLGFREVARSTSFPMEMFALLGDIYIDNDMLGRECHKRRVGFDLALARTAHGEARRQFYTALAKAGFGREVILIAEKA